ncbi:MAG: hypothetical protein KA715_08110 [Xanthomonadaceae bacterium]|nr:hypothetical protein [Xanthomonadaceae bacterium]
MKFVILALFVSHSALAQSTPSTVIEHENCNLRIFVNGDSFNDNALFDR